MPNDDQGVLFEDQPPTRSEPLTMEDIFGKPISVYTTEQGVDDGVFIALDRELCREAGYKLPVVLTSAAYGDVIEWTRDDIPQDETGRAWDVLTVMRRAARAALTSPDERVPFSVMRIPNTGRGQTARRARLHMVAQAYDTSLRPCLTILLPDED